MGGLVAEIVPWPPRLVCLVDLTVTAKLFCIVSGAGCVSQAQFTVENSTAATVSYPTGEQIFWCWSSVCGLWSMHSAFSFYRILSHDNRP